MHPRQLLHRPAWTLATSLLLLFAAAAGLVHFRLDASSDSLVLEQDQDLRLYDETRRVFGSDSSLVVVLQPPGDPFDRQYLEDLEALCLRLDQVDGVAGTLALPRAPLFLSPPKGLFRLAEGFGTLRDGAPIDLARAEVDGHPLYSEALVALDLETTAIQIELEPEQELLDLEQERYALRDLEEEGAATAEQVARLAAVEKAFRAETLAAADRRRAQVAELRDVLADASGWNDGSLGVKALGGLPMIAVDLVRFIERDMVIFGIASVLFVVLAVSLLFRSLRWTIAITIHCTLTVAAVLGLLGWMDWRVTVVTSNLSSLLFIMTLAMSVHIAVRTREEATELTSRRALLRALDHVFVPCAFTVLTTMVGFGSLYLSRMPPVMDFSLMMALGLGVSFVASFTLLPSLVLVLGAELPPPRAATAERYRRIAEWALDHRTLAFSVALAISILGLVGMSRLSVENSFMDYFRDSSEIHRGLELIDAELGGTTPLEIVLQSQTPDRWLDVDAIAQLADLHTWLEEQPEVGKVTSLKSLVDLLEQIIAADPNPALRNAQVNTFLLRSLRARIPEDVARTALKPYVSDDYGTTRITARIHESVPGLDRSALLARIQARLEEQLVAAADTQLVTGMFVLYNNMIESLFRSQVSTLLVVLGSIVVMFWIMLRSVRLSFIALVPNLFPIVVVLGTLGWAGVPLDMMTIMIAAIALGISVDDTVHYLYRYRAERANHSRREALGRAHMSVGRALVATTVAITFGFSIMVLSNFKPTIYFGLMTGLAMLAALAADGLLLPGLILGYEREPMAEADR